jgi:hypothetical protein
VAILCNGHRQRACISLPGMNMCRPPDIPGIQIPMDIALHQGHRLPMAPPVCCPSIAPFHLRDVNPRIDNMRLPVIGAIPPVPRAATPSAYGARRDDTLSLMCLDTIKLIMNCLPDDNSSRRMWRSHPHRDPDRLTLPMKLPSPGFSPNPPSPASAFCPHYGAT